MNNVDRIISTYSNEIQRILDKGAVVDSTWRGLLADFLRECDLVRGGARLVHELEPWEKAFLAGDDQPDDGGHFPDMDDPTKQAHADLDRDPLPMGTVMNLPSVMELAETIWLVYPDQNLHDGDHYSFAYHYSRGDFRAVKAEKQAEAVLALIGKKND